MINFDYKVKTYCVWSFQYSFVSWCPKLLQHKILFFSKLFKNNLFCQLKNHFSSKNNVLSFFSKTNGWSFIEIRAATDFGFDSETEIPRRHRSTGTASDSSCVGVVVVVVVVDGVVVVVVVGGVVSSVRNKKVSLKKIRRSAIRFRLRFDFYIFLKQGIMMLLLNSWFRKWNVEIINFGLTFLSKHCFKSVFLLQTVWFDTVANRYTKVEFYVKMGPYISVLMSIRC